MEIKHDKVVEDVYLITEEDVKTMVEQSGYDAATIEDYYIFKASDKILGFLADYWKLRIDISYKGDRKPLHFFIKALSTTVSKANFAKEMKLLDKEINFYSILKTAMSVSGLSPYCAEFVTALDDALVLSDLNAMQYRSRNKFYRLDSVHTLETLKTLARFHASSIIFEDKKTKELGRIYRITDDYEHMLDNAGYNSTSVWYINCMQATKRIVKLFSKYSKDDELLKRIEQNLPIAFHKALQLTEASTRHKNVINHRDLWNNNILFRYKLDESGVLQPDDCVLVDFALIHYQPLVSDVMFFLCCNLDRKTRDENMTSLLNFYHKHLGEILSDNNVDIYEVMPLDDFVKSADEYMLWGMTVAVCLCPLTLLDDDILNETFTKTEKFDEIMLKDKVPFIIEVMKSEPGYKKSVLDILEEYVERYCLEEEKTE